MNNDFNIYNLLIEHANIFAIMVHKGWIPFPSELGKQSQLMVIWKLMDSIDWKWPRSGGETCFIHNEHKQCNLQLDQRCCQNCCEHYKWLSATRSHCRGLHGPQQCNKLRSILQLYCFQWHFQTPEVLLDSSSVLINNTGFLATSTTISHANYNRKGQAATPFLCITSLKH